jgi:hypothetical protein
LKRRVPAPKPLLKLPSVLLKRERQPTAVFAAPVVTFARAPCPSAVLKFGKAVSGAACAMGKNAKQQTATSIVVNMMFLFFMAPRLTRLRRVCRAKRMSAASWLVVCSAGCSTVRLPGDSARPADVRGPTRRRSNLTNAGEACPQAVFESALTILARELHGFDLSSKKRRNSRRPYPFLATRFALFVVPCVFFCFLYLPPKPSVRDSNAIRSWL